MRKFLFILLLSPILVTAQQLELGVSGSTGKFISAEIGYIRDVNGFYLGFGQELNGPKGKHVTQILSNYGQEIRGFGIQKKTFDLKYSRALNDKLAVRISGTYGWKYAYAEYYDARFKDGGYYTSDNTESMFGGGGDLLYSFTNHFGIMAGYNSIRKGEGGLFVKF